MDLEQLRALVAVAEAESLAGAARASGLSRTTLRRRLESLSSSLDAEVVVSDGRDIAVTPVGRLVVARSRAILEQTMALGEEVRTAVADSPGRLCMYIPTSVHPLAAAMIRNAVKARLPDLEFDARFAAAPLTMLERDGDLAVHWGPLPDQGARVARRVGSVPLRLLASRTYTDARGVPQSLEELADHDLLTHDGGGLTGDRLPLLDGGSWPVRPSVRSNQLMLCGAIARQGGGIALVPDARLSGDEWPDVVRVLPDLVGHNLANWVVGRETLSRRPALVPLLDEIAAMIEAATL